MQSSLPDTEHLIFSDPQFSADILQRKMHFAGLGKQGYKRNRYELKRCGAKRLRRFKEHPEAPSDALRDSRRPSETLSKKISKILKFVVDNPLRPRYYVQAVARDNTKASQKQHKEP